MEFKFERARFHLDRAKFYISEHKGKYICFDNSKYSWPSFLDYAEMHIEMAEEYLNDVPVYNFMRRFH